VHGDEPVAKGPNGDHDRGNLSRFKQTCEVSHGHVTNRSDRDHYDTFDLLLFKKLYPNWPGVVEQT
jgi:hypothetical protein